MPALCSKHLPPPTLMCIMGPVFANYKKKLIENAKERMLKDVELFREKLGKLGGCGGDGRGDIRDGEGKIIAGTS
ncbi:hypothetical protein BGX38DRAFT_1193043 [Terfezia claveryi]|nr:hypothetical protein BGX38DRAFT_1193043 [Terfezia claveryi]